MNFKYKKPEDGKDKNGNPVKIYKAEHAPNFYLWWPPEPTRSGEFRQLVIHCINAMGAAKRTGYYFDMRGYFDFHGVTTDMVHELRQAMIEVKPLTNPDWYNEYTPLIKEWMDNWKEKNGTTLKGLKCKEEFTTDSLEMIFNRLCKEKLVNTSDRDKFLSIFTNSFIGLVYWNSDTKIIGSKAGLFDLMQRLTGDLVTASMLKNYFYVEGDIHDNWRSKKETRIIDRVI